MTEFKVFFASPFAPEYKWIRDAVAEACRLQTVTLRAVDEVVQPGSSIIETIHQEIDDSDFAVVVISSLNPNVMYELGRLLQASKPVVLLADENAFQQLPFDLRSFAIIKYKADEKLRSELTTIVSATIARIIRIITPGNSKKFAEGNLILPTLPPIPSSFQLDIADKIDFESRKKEVERRLGKTSPCRTIEMESQSDDEGSVSVYTMVIRCPDGDDVVIIIDLNGEVKRAKVR